MRAPSLQDDRTPQGDALAPRWRVVLAPFAATLLGAAIAWLGTAADVAGPAVLVAVAILVLGGGVAGTGALPARRLQTLPRALLGLLVGCVLVDVAVVAGSSEPPAGLGAALAGGALGGALLAVIIGPVVAAGYILLPPLLEAVGLGTWWRQVPPEVLAAGRAAVPGSSSVGSEAQPGDPPLRASVAGMETVRHATINLGLISILGVGVAGGVALAIGGPPAARLPALVILLGWMLVVGLVAATRVPSRAVGNVAGMLLAGALLFVLAELQESRSVTWSLEVGVALGVACAALVVAYLVGRAVVEAGGGGPDVMRPAGFGRPGKLSVDLAAATDRGTADVVLRVYPPNAPGRTLSLRETQALQAIGYHVVAQAAVPGPPGGPNRAVFVCFVRQGIDPARVPGDDELLRAARRALAVEAAGGG